MARKAAPNMSAAPKVPAAQPAAAPAVDVDVTPVSVTEVRKTVAPKTAAPAVKKALAPVTYARIAERAYYIAESSGRSEFDNWLRAENELNNENV